MERCTYSLPGAQPQYLRDAQCTLATRPELLDGFAAVLTSILGDDSGIADIPQFATLKPRGIGLIARRSPLFPGAKG